MIFEEQVDEEKRVDLNRYFAELNETVQNPQHSSSSSVYQVRAPTPPPNLNAADLFIQ